LPELPEGCVMVMDNASFHKRSDMIDAIAEKGHILLFMPPYSPDLNPIEQKWAEVKSIRRKYKLSAEESLKTCLVF
jgi:transposase